MSGPFAEGYAGSGSGGYSLDSPVISPTMPNMDQVENIMQMLYNTKESLYSTAFLFPFEDPHDTWERRNARHELDHTIWLTETWARALGSNAARCLFLEPDVFLFRKWMDPATPRGAAGFARRAREQRAQVRRIIARRRDEVDLSDSDDDALIFPIPIRYLEDPPREPPPYYSAENGQALEELLHEICSDVFESVDEIVCRIDYYSQAKEKEAAVEQLYHEAAKDEESILVVSTQDWIDFWEGLGFLQCAKVQLDTKTEGAHEHVSEFFCLAKFPEGHGVPPDKGVYPKE
ncbi:hypothetical protein MGN70_006716 [Eutypa lata]|nr:hypothetical protein MGN70_006716 [Eutypa lata]